MLATLNPKAQRIFARPAPPDPLRDAIATALGARGHQVRAHVGGASFRCDLAILAEDGSGYALGILLDGQAAATEDRYVFQPAILRAFGWKVFDVPVHGWLRDSAAVIAGIEAALHRDIDAGDDDPFEGATLPPRPAPEPAASISPDDAEPSAASPGLTFSNFHLQQGSSDKFWKIAVSGADTVVVFGRAGTKGSMVTKTFETPERARREATKLIAEKVRKGYVEH